MIRSSISHAADSCGEPFARGLMQQVQDLAVDVELELPGRVVADANRERTLVPGEPLDRYLGDPALAADAVHDPQVSGVAGDRTQQPLAPCLRLVVVARHQQAVEGERRVAQPAEPVVPVPRAAELLGQRRRRRGDDAAGRAVGQRLQRDQRAHHRVAPLAAVLASRRPPRPVPDGVPEGVERIDLGRHRLVGAVPRRARTRPVAPARIVRSDATVPVVTSIGASVRRCTASGPATARTPCGTSRSHGTARP